MLELFFTSFEKFFGPLAGLILLSFVSVYLFFIKLPTLIDSISYSKSRKIARMNEAINSKYVDETIKKIFKREISSFYVSNAFGIKAGKKELEKVESLQRLVVYNYSVKEIYHTIRFFPKNKSVMSLTVNDLENIKNEIIKNRNRGFFSAFVLFLITLAFGYFGIYPILSIYKFGSDVFSDLLIIITYGFLYISTIYTAIILIIDAVMRNKNIEIVNDRIAKISQS